MKRENNCCNEFPDMVHYFMINPVARIFRYKILALITRKLDIQLQEYQVTSIEVSRFVI